MDKKALLNELFYVAYHTDDMAGSVKKFLRENFPTSMDNRHVSSMMSFCNTISDRGIDNTHPMLFGMLVEAWRQFLAELA